MIRSLVLCAALMCALMGPAFAQLDSPNAIPIFYTRIPHHMFSTQFNFSAGTGQLSANDKPFLSASAEVKGMYNITGALYLSTGAGLSHLRSETRPPDGMPGRRRSIWHGYLPSGVGFSMGDDHATIITGFDLLPGIYLGHGPLIERPRTLAFGFGPEFGFLFRVGPRHHKGLLLGMVGKIQFMQTPDLNDGPGFRYTYGGVGLVVRFY